MLYLYEWAKLISMYTAFKKIYISYPQFYFTPGSKLISLSKINVFTPLLDGILYIPTKKCMYVCMEENVVWLV